MEEFGIKKIEKKISFPMATLKANSQMKPD